ncbi:TAXI family TRAP transporter solute-binding subunit [Solimicrobium silvestre]|uniref:NMT1/THI5 like n=1 Tax=Solimicrobium silvestre TaxID=2099400 RepID=A0A2S9GSP9_9BURK|nr:TAXI family TRAP transporter solute-binding subunit [Solimicrobium silvestre]PRC90744.1 NMT1/THI5 like [Solimicrobium silvestre]
MQKFKFRRGRSLFKDIVWTILPILLLGVGGSWIAYHYIDPAPPHRLVILTGAEDSSYQDFAKSYKEILAGDGIELVIRQSNGALDNHQRLRDPNSDVDLGFLQDGLNETASDDEVEPLSLGSISYEPLWVFYRAKQPITRFSGLAGKRLAIGREGSGTKLLATRLLAASGVTADNSTLQAIGRDEAAAQLLAGKLDAVFVIGEPDSPLVQQLAADSQVRILDLDQAAAIARHFPYLHELRVPHGLIDIRRNLPAQDITLLATTTTLAARETVHPALISLLMKAMHETHSEAGLLHSANEFPSAKDVDLELSKEAEHYYKSGPPLLQRYLPFWLATLIDRAALVLIPLLAALIPVIRAIPQIYNWRIRRQIYRWYGELSFLETQLRDKPAEVEIAVAIRQLDHIEEKVQRAKLPLTFAEHSYVLKEHIDFVRRRILKPETKPTGPVA